MHVTKTTAPSHEMQIQMRRKDEEILRSEHSFNYHYSQQPSPLQAVQKKCVPFLTQAVGTELFTTVTVQSAAL
jgi:hypothetical protein